MVRSGFSPEGPPYDVRKARTLVLAGSTRDCADVVDVRGAGRQAVEIMCVAGRVGASHAARDEDHRVLVEGAAEPESWSVSARSLAAKSGGILGFPLPRLSQCK